MKLVLRVLAVVVVVAAVALWLGGGQNTGFTKTTRTSVQVDPVTELRYPVEHKGFYPGVDFLIASGLLVVALWGVSFFAGKKISPSEAPPI